MSWTATLNVSAALSTGAVHTAVQEAYVTDTSSLQHGGFGYSMLYTAVPAATPLPYTVKVLNEDGCTAFSYNASFSGCSVACYQNTTCAGACDCGGLLDPLAIVPFMTYIGECGGDYHLNLFNINVTQGGGQPDLAVYGCFSGDHPLYMASQVISPHPASVTLPGAVSGLGLLAPRAAAFGAAAGHGAVVRDGQVYSILMQFLSFSPYPAPVSVFQPPADCTCSA